MSSVSDVPVLERLPANVCLIFPQVTKVVELSSHQVLKNTHEKEKKNFEKVKIQVHENQMRSR